MSLLRLFFSIMLLKAKPQDIPYKPRALVAIVLFYIFSGIFVLSKSTEPDIAVFSVILDVAVLAIFSAVCLNVLGLKVRLAQTFAALYGTGAIYHMLAWPIIEQLNQNDLIDSTKSILSLMFLLLLSWQILTYAHIYRNALSVDMIKAVVLSIAYWLMSMTLSQIIIN